MIDVENLCIRQGAFQLANVTSAFVWAGVLLTIGDVVTKGLRLIWG